MVGFIGRIHPSILDSLKLPSDADLVYYTLDLASLESLASSLQLTASSYHTLQDHILVRDLAFVLDCDHSSQTLIDAVQKLDHITDVTVFDVYQGEHLPLDKKSIAIQITIHHPDNNLTTDDINTILDQAIEAGKSTGAVLRSEFTA